MPGYTEIPELVSAFSTATPDSDPYSPLDLWSQPAANGNATATAYQTNAEMMGMLVPEGEGAEAEIEEQAPSNGFDNTPYTSEQDLAVLLAAAGNQGNAAAAPAANDNNAQAAQAGPAYKTKALPGHYAGEDTNATFRGNTPEQRAAWSRHMSSPNAEVQHLRTIYMSDQEQEASDVQVNRADGLLRNAAGGLIDTAGASGTGTQCGLGLNKHIMAMTPKGDIRATDAWAGHQETPLGAPPSAMEMQRARATGKEVAPTPYSLAMMNHSSLVAGGAVAGAGEIAVDQGKLTQVTDQSGHYQPTSKMTNQVLRRFEDKGVDMHDVGVKLTPKAGALDLQGNDPDRKYLHASAREFMSYGGSRKTEKKMRNKRANRKGLIEEAHRARMLRQGAGTMSMGGQDVAATPALVDPRSTQKAPGRDVTGRTRNLIQMFEGMY